MSQPPTLAQLQRLYKDCTLGNERPPLAVVSTGRARELGYDVSGPGPWHLALQADGTYEISMVIMDDDPDTKEGEDE